MKIISVSFEGIMKTSVALRPLCLSLALATLSTVAAAQNENASENPEEPLDALGFDQNSPFCGYTFFTEDNDTLDFSGGLLETCFDMRGGDDLLILNRSDYPEGIMAVTGSGRDIVWATDGPDNIIDNDGEDDEIRTYDGDDTIEIRVPVERDPFRGIKITEQTKVRPGSGTNRISISPDLYSNSFARASPNVRLWAQGDSLDYIDASCGRPNNSVVYDLRVVDVPNTAAVNVDSIGCGVGIFSISGDLILNQLGGRFSLSTQKRGFQPESSIRLPILTARVTGGAGAFIDLTRADPMSSLVWDGPEIAFVRSHFDRSGSGGKYTLFGDDLVHLELSPSDAEASFRLGSLSDVEISISASPVSSEIITMAAPRMEINWYYELGAVFPSINNDWEMHFPRTSFIVPEIDYYNAESIFDLADLMFDESMRDRIKSLPDQDFSLADEIEVEGDVALSPQDSLVTKSLSAELPTGVVDIVKIFEMSVFKPGFTRLRIRIREASDPNGVCIAAHLVDIDDVYPTISVSCTNLLDPLRSLNVEAAVHYEELRFSGAGAPNTIFMNADSGMVINRVEVAI